MPTTTFQAFEVTNIFFLTFGQGIRRYIFFVTSYKYRSFHKKVTSYSYSYFLQKSN